MPDLTRGFYNRVATLTCTIISLVPFRMQWYKGNEPIGNELFYTESKEVELDVPDANSFSEGVYTCNATNPQGDGSAQTFLDIRDPPPKILPPANVSVIPGENAVLTCLAFSTVDYNLTWYRENSIEELNAHPRARKFLNGSVEIRNVQKADEGKFICRAMNEGGFTDAVVHLRVQDSPIVSVNPETQNFVSGQLVRIICSAIAFPPPEFVWLRENRLISPSGRFEFNDGEMLIHDVERSDEGEYECQATNPAGQDRAFAKINYIQAPKVTVDKDRMLVANGDTVTMVCNAEGIPPPKIEWFKGETQLIDLSFIQITKSGELIILGVQEMDAGDYNCVASNEAGSDEATIALDVGSIPEIVQAPNSVGIAIEKNATLPCSADGLPPPTVTWRREDGQPMDFSARGRFRQLPSGALFIRKITLDDEGLYVCSVSNQFGTQDASAYITVTGVVRPVIAYTNPYYEAIESRTVQLSCLVLLGNPRPKVMWLKHGEVVQNSDRFKVSNNGVLEIVDVDAKDEGEYTCVATNVGGNATFMARLDVQIPARIKDDGIHEVTVVQGRSVTLPCEVSGDPRPIIEWTRNSNRISPTDPHYFINELGSLEIFSADPQDSATYSCEAMNVAGVASKKITLYVHVPPQIDHSEDEFTVIVGNSVTLPCSNSGIPRPILTWRKDGESLGRVDQRYGFLPQGGLRIDQTYVDDAGVYECIASNIAGNDTKLITLIIQVPPTIVSEGPTDIVVISGQPVLLECETEGDPSPFVRWKKNGESITFLEQEGESLGVVTSLSLAQSMKKSSVEKMMKEKRFFEIKGTGSLLMPKVKVQDTGRYMCIAENPAGFVTRDFSLTVHNPPFIPVDIPFNMSIIENNPLLLLCPAKGTPPPVINWYKDGVEITGNEIGVRILRDGSLQFDRAQASDAGEYKCVATNVAGNATHTNKVKILVPPTITGPDLPENPKVIVGKEMRMRCPANAIPPPKIEWFKDGKLLDPDNLDNHISILNNGGEIVIREAILKDTARYTCVASNVAGTSKKNFDLQILEPPKIDLTKASENNISVIVNNAISIDCPVTGTPLPIITWFKDGYPINPDIDPNVRIVSDGQRLLFTISEVRDTGRYRCTATNIAGRDNKSFDLSVHVPPKIEGSNEISRPEVIINQTTILKCQASGIPLPKIRWFKDEAPIKFNTSRLTFLDLGWKLKIQHSQVEDTGRYFCRAISIAGENEKFFDLNVLVPPTIERGSILTYNPKVVENQTITINCPANGIPTPEITWLKDEELVNRLDQRIQFLSNGRQLRLSVARVSDTGRYRCLVTNKAGEDYADFDLEVHVPSTIDTRDVDLDPKVIVNKTTIIECPTRGIPPPEITWLKNGEAIDFSRNPHLRTIVDGKQLEILRARVTDTARYTCRASNEAGSVEQDYSLEVWVPPYIDESRTSKSNPQVIVNQTIIVSCMIEGIPTPRITWLRNGRKFNISGTDFFPGVNRFSLLDGDRQLKIVDSKVPDTARYSCIGINNAGTVDRDFDLDVLVPPHIDTNGLNISPEVVKGRTVHISCPADGIPFPNITWLKENRPISLGGGRVRVQAQGRQLEITRSIESDTARYTCVASNIAGQAKQDFDLHVLVPPSIDESNLVDNPRVIVNRTVVLECPVSGIPEPTIKWLKDGNSLVTGVGLELLSNGRQLEIASAQVTDTGRYTCIANNKAGELRRNFDLEVLVPPEFHHTIATEFQVVENRTVYIDCPADSIPPPSFIWYKDRQPLFDFPYPNLALHNNGRQLQVISAKTSDTAVYKCVATNVAGQLKQQFKLEVFVPPQLENNRVPIDLSVIVRQPIIVKCEPTGIPVPSIIWYRDGNELTPGLFPHIRVLDGGRTLQIVSAEVSDTTRYTCRAENPAGQAEKYFNLAVHVPPTINGSRGVQTLSVVIGQSITIDCPADGIPPPRIRWFREGEPLSLLSNPNLRVVNNGRQLSIINAQLLDIGDYMCIASNAAGNHTKEFKLDVLVPPKIEEYDTRKAVSVDTRTQLLCETLGLPEPDITWEKDGNVIPNNGLRYRMHRSGTIEFSSVKVDDSATYRCTATNEAGTDSREMLLEVQVPPTINSQGPQELKVVIEDSVTLPCEATGLPQPVISWQKGTRLIGQSAGYQSLPDGALRIARAQIRDTGIYICIAQNNAGTALGQVKLEVQVPPSIEDQQKKYTVIQDREVILPCRAEGLPPPKILWEKDGQAIVTSNFHYRIMRSGWLAIPVARTDDSGVFTCIAENNAGKASIILDLIVQVPPHISDDNRIYTVSQGDTANLPCQAAGIPPPAISWIRDGRTMIKEDQRYTIREDGMLVFGNVETEDRGSYVCTAINEAGRDSKEVVLRVQVPPVIRVIPRDQEVALNGRIELECAADGTPPPSITWQVNNTYLSSTPSVNGRSMVTIENARKEDAGTYACLAENPAGKTRAVAGVQVKVPPKVLVPPGNRAVTIAQRVILTCTVQGDPPPKITWLKNGRTVQLDNRIQQMENGSLVIYESDESDAGDYKCVAANDAGSIEHTATLTINMGPNFKVEPKDKTIPQGESVIFNCVAEAEPTPFITWKKEYVDILQENDRVTILPNNSLRIIASQLDDSGIYICIARNSLGSVLVKAELTVQVHGMWSKWSGWGDCSRTCGRGAQYRIRECENPAPANGGRACVGPGKESRACISGNCPVDGSWSDWTAWEECSKTCGAGERSRFRKCDDPPPQFGGSGCVGAALETVKCNVQSCPIDGGWGEWGEWQHCSETCGDGTQERFRRCNKPRAQYGGRECTGRETERQPCKIRDCSIHGSWGGWAQWSTCSLSCGGGTRTRSRTCDNPPPAHNGRFCPGRDKQRDYCNAEPCPVHGNWAGWSDFGACTATCGGGQKRRFRTCTNPPPSNNGRPCIGVNTDTAECAEDACPVHGGWSKWSQWSECSKTCGTGQSQRTRVCTPPQFGGKTCLGDDTMVRKCNSFPCEVEVPHMAIGNVIGTINDKEFGIALLLANMTNVEDSTLITARLEGIPGDIGRYFQHLISILTPVTWTTAYELGEAVNGWTLAKGVFRREVQVEFATGEVLRMTHISRGLNKKGILTIDIIVNGYIPDIPEQARVTVAPYVEDYIQTGPGSIYAKSTRMFHVNGHRLPYAWNHTITYDDSLGRMPYLVQRLSADELHVDFDISSELIQYQMTAKIAKGNPSNRCPTGFFLDPVGPYCKDDDECIRLNPCSHFCHNTPGSYSCSCPFGYSIGSDGKTCKDVDECDMNIAQCHSTQECINSIGSYKCVAKCQPGFRRTSSELACQDIDECKQRPRLCSQQCINTLGSYHCQCRRGYRLIGGKRCRDIDECAENNPCSNGCRNIRGSYRCSCPPGYRLRGRGGQCVDVDECRTKKDNCARDQECRNTDGSFQCVNICPTGLEPASNGTCIDIDECARKTSKCGYNQLCANTVGGYTCNCPRGYTTLGPGEPCTDIDECISRGRCQHECT
ncbi:unnamed protein product, partial [Owenia fusiformis]